MAGSVFSWLLGIGFPPSGIVATVAKVLFKGAARRWFAALANPRVIIALVVVALVFGGMKQREGYRQAAQICEAKSKEAVADLKQQVAHARQAAQDAADEANEQSLIVIRDLQEQLRTKNAKFKSQLEIKGSDCGWTPDLIERLR